MSERNYWQRMRRQRLSRRTLLRSSARAGIGAAGLALVGCGDDDDDAQQAVAVPQQQDQPEQPAAQQTQQQQAPTQQADQQADQADQQDAPADEQQQEQQVVQQAAPARQYGGNYSVVIPPNWDGFDPHKANLATPFHIFNDSMGRLVQIYDNQGPVYVADIASLPEIPDDETYIFSFDQGRASGTATRPRAGAPSLPTTPRRTSSAKSSPSTRMACPTAASGAPPITRAPNRSTRPTSKRSSARPTAPTRPTSKPSTWATRS